MARYVIGVKNGKGGCGDNVPSEGRKMRCRGFVWTVLIVAGVAALATHPSMVRRVNRPAFAVTHVESAHAVVIPIATEPQPTSAPRDRRPPKTKPTPQGEPATTWETKIETNWVEPDKADEAVLDGALNRLCHELRLSVPMPRERAKKWLLFGKIKTTEAPAGIREMFGVDVVKATVDVELTPEGWRELARMERSWVAHERMESAARLVAILSVILGAIAGYIRLDEMTKGYYTGRLRILALLLVAVTTVVIANVN